MPKIISPETRNQVKKNHLLGLTRDENAENAGISAGAVSSILSQFSKEIGEANFEALTRYTRTLREHDMSLVDSIKGFHIVNLANKIGTDPDKLPEFLRDVFIPYKDSNLTASELILHTKEFVEFLKSSEMTPEELQKYCNDLLNKKQELEKQVQLLEENRANAKRETTSILEQNKVTLEKISDFEQTLQELEKYDISIDDVPKLAKMLKTAEKSDWDNSKITDYLAESEKYESQIITKKKELEKINEVIDEKTTQNVLLDKKIESKELRIKKLESTTKTLKDQETELKASVRTMTEFSLNQIKTITKNATESISKAQFAHLDSLNELSRNFDEKSTQATKKQNDKLEGIANIMDEFISETIKSAENAGNIRALVPFHKILNSKGEDYEIYPAIILILERFEIWYQKQDSKNSKLTSIIDELISIMKDHLKE
ncbi:hypothetical protein AAA799E16_00054 [Marine Group I thaumarchaeote SCGC AAA799-E16]|uniref:Uncharacterized protein n=4 Tax=Marine Group I TaxID=905826 RepID=A0A087S8T1_9ARCH|nr:hypothetical protein AAA799E16_00054 [Marine Group I thaumarchaeote SCGC AAA799-E16]KFM17351.1 hypothetical protein AAA799D11_00148 [Marine Group I thaumarchaeote SCGC AAA799-D11]KFM19371.1 hypothetical protein SCCGRSA3_00519 [Marine Group I thaumarchaeote SCGC RSA3]KFM22135.1 hypothetical protein AAA799B03_00290 [Marine Group I thaumarchaeote SCGC AAA799-B03]